ncbi:flagellar biosynthetic protein FliO [Rhizobium sp. BG4]|uniref:flagellar biosynthetic protein FliO n=1 Tax=Rhizobium sp. BG4 TaxID=2613770 RepID=UPI00193E3D50|nr:flagellar biosynthetic protein FliO [Rhizobium sp. BG4]QRM45311.1 flagellar biosynthesis protein FliO [Rhizobium sp. BG4]
MLDSVMTDYGSRFLYAAGGVGLALLVLVGVLWLMRTRAPSPFVRGGKNRQPRLQVLDAAAVDARRRLVLVRRDNVEHLIMIGGPSDVVIESRILPESAEEPKPVAAPRPAAPAAPAAPIAEFRPQPVAERPQLRAVPDPRPEPRPEPKIEPKAEQKPEPVAIFEEEEAEPEPYVPAPAPVIEPRRPQPIAPVAVAPVAAPAPAAEPAPAPAIIVPPVIPAPETRVQPPISIRPAERAEITHAPETASNAADILDAARARVLPQQVRIEPQVSTPAAQSLPTVSEGTPVVTADAGAPPQQPKGDFQRILEEEMNTNFTAERVVQPVPTILPAQSMPVRPVIPPQPANLPRRDPEMAPVTGADAELQKEVARIFGEMSVNRDK